MTGQTEQSTQSRSLLGPITTKSGLRQSLVLVILFLLGFIPWPWYYSPTPYVGGWLPFPLAYWWALEAVYTVFIFYITYRWLNSTRAKRMQQAQQEDRIFADAPSGGED